MKIGNEVGRLTKMIRKNNNRTPAIPVADVGREKTHYQDRVQTMTYGMTSCGKDRRRRADEWEVLSNRSLEVRWVRRPFLYKEGVFELDSSALSK
jgi:hypothetical protein